MKLYKKDSKGRIRQLVVQTREDSIVQISGLVDGKTVTHIKQVKPKNIGKKNETNSMQQAALERDSIINKKIKEGYFFLIEEAKNSNIILPMLAKSMDTHGKKVVFPCYAQPKLDGMRCIANDEHKISRKNTPIDTVEHIKLHGIDSYIDGELYAHGKSFQENMSLLKKNDNGCEDIKYHVYDLISDKPFIERYNDLTALVDGLDHVKLVETVKIASTEELQAYHMKCLEKGYEGTIVRWGNAGYKVNGRSENLLKYKDFIDVALPIVDVVESDRVPGQGIVVIEYNGHISKTGSKLSHKERANLLLNRDDYIGKTAEIRYFEETDKGALRFPVFYGIRLDK